MKTQQDMNFLPVVVQEEFFFCCWDFNVEQKGKTQKCFYSASGFQPSAVVGKGP